MAIKKTDGQETVVNQNQVASQFVDTIWDNYLSGVKMFFASQQELEKMLMQVMERQSESWEMATENFNKSEQELKKMIEEMREAIQQNLAQVGGEQMGKTFADWNKRLDEIANRLQQLTLTPNKAGITVFNQSQEQWQSSLKRLSEQQQKTRKEMQTLTESFFSQLKLTQKGFAEAMEANTNFTMNLFK